MADPITVEVHDRSAKGRNQIHDIILEALTDVFENDILPEARDSSPVGTEPVRAGSKRNRDSIEVKTFMTKKGPFAKIFTTSGHGGFLEVGTTKMSAQPYIYPAVQGNIGKLPAKVKEAIDTADSKANGQD